MKLKLESNKTNIAEIEAYLAYIALKAITEDLAIDSLFSCPTVYCYTCDMHLQTLHDIETALIRLRAYSKALVKCKVTADVLLDVIKAESTKKRAETFKASVTDTYTSDSMNLTELKFFMEHFVLQD